MKKEDMKNVIELLKLAKIGERVKEEEQKEKPEIEAVEFTLPETLTTIQP